MNKIVPIGGVHKTASSLLAEIMSDDMVEKVIVLTMDKDRNMKFAHLNFTDEEMSLASIILQKKVMDLL
jgi:hypothetical protein